MKRIAPALICLSLVLPGAALAQSADWRALEIREKALGPQHPDAAATQQRLAAVRAAKQKN